MNQVTAATNPSAPAAHSSSWLEYLSRFENDPSSDDDNIKDDADYEYSSDDDDDGDDDDACMMAHQNLQQQDHYSSYGQKDTAAALAASAHDVGCHHSRGGTDATECLWRLDPDVSFSDYSIIIRTQQRYGRSKRYNVHKVFLSVGQHSSRYFASLFTTTKKNSNHIENQNDVSTIELPAFAAHAFPTVLDFIYTRGVSCDFSQDPKLMLGAMFVANYLDIPALWCKCVDLIRCNVSCDYFHEYYEYALSLGMKGVIQLIQEIVTANIHDFPPGHALWRVLTLESMMEIVSSDDLLMGQTCCSSQELSKLVYSFAQERYSQQTQQKEKQAHQPQHSQHAAFTLEDFHLLTQQDFLPVIDHSVAMRLIELEKKMMGGQQDLDIQQHNKETSLQIRCFKAIEEGMMKDVNFGDENDEVLEFLRHNPSKLAIDLLIRHICGHCQKG